MAKVQLEGILKLVDVQINSQVFRKISQQVAGLPPALQRTSDALGKSDRNAKKLNKSLSKTKSQLSQNERAAQMFLQRMAQFAILLPTFATLNRVIQGSVKFLFEFDSALRDIVRIDISGLADRMEEVGDSALQTAQDFGVSATEVLATTKIFKQAGFTIEESQEKAKAAILATQISTLSSIQAIELFISAEKQFGDAGRDAIAVLDKVAKVEDEAAVAASDVADAFRTGGNSLAEFSKDLNDSVGLIAALREQTRKSGREIGTFFKTLQTRVFAAGEARDAVESLGIEVQNLDGTLRPTLSVLNDLKGRFDNLTEAQQANVAKSIAGIRQFEGLIATLKSLERANELSAKAAQSAGTSDAKRLITDAKLERQLGKLTAAGEAFAESLGDAGVGDALTKILNIATKLVSVLTTAQSAFAEMGGSITPLLALGGITLGRSIFGLGRGESGQPTQPGQKGFIGPTQPKSLLGPQASAGMKALGQSTKLLAADFKGLAIQVAGNTAVSRARGVQVKVSSTKLAQFGLSLSRTTATLGRTAMASAKNASAMAGTTGGLVALTLAAGFMPKAFDAIENKLDSFGNSFTDVAAQFTGIGGAGATMGAQFAFLGQKAAGAAVAFGVIQESIGRIIASVEENEAAKADIERDKKNARATKDLDIRFSEDDVGQNFIKALQENVDGIAMEDFGAGIQNTFKQFSLGLGEFFKGADIAQVVFSDFKGGADSLRSLVTQQEDYIRSIAEQEGTTEQLNSLLAKLQSRSIRASEALKELAQVVGAGSDLTTSGTAKKDIGFPEFKEAQKVTLLAESVRALGLDLEMARLGPEAMSDSLVRMDQEFMLSQRSFSANNTALNQELSKLVGELNNLGVGLSISGDSAVEFLARVLKGTEEMTEEGLNQFAREIEQMPANFQDNAKMILKILEKQSQGKIKIQNEENALLEARATRARALRKVEADAALNAFAATQKFNAELKQFGKTVDADVLSAFQGASLGDVEDVLAGTSGLDQGLQDLILGAFAGPVAKAQVLLQGVSATTESELNILAKTLEDVNSRLADSANANDIVALTTEKRNIELQIEATKQKSSIEATSAKIKVLEAEVDAAEDAAKAEAERKELLEKLQTASSDFSKELRDIERSFEQFSEDKISDLLKEEADARGELKDAQKETLDSTKTLSEAYDELIDAQLQFAGAIVEAQIKSKLLARDMSVLTGGITTFDGRLTALNNAFTTVLNDANISLSTRIDLERQLAEETLQFLQQAQQEITQAGIGVFGQTSGENQALSQGIAGLNFVAQQLGGSFEAFNQLGSADFSQISQELLSLPAEFRQQILSALGTLPSTASIGGFSVEQLQQAIGQVGAGVNASEGLPSIEELNSQQVEQLTKMQELGLQSAQLQFEQVIAAREQVAIAQEELDTAKLLEQRANENLMAVRDEVVEQSVVLDMANAERRDLLAQVIAADDKNTLAQIEREAELFADQNSVFREVGNEIIRGIGAAVGAKLSVIEAQAGVNAATGHIPNFAAGNLSTGEAAGVLRAAMREKRAMPGGASLAVANTSEAIIPMHGGSIPNFAEGNVSPIAAGIDAIRSINESVVAAIVRSVTEALGNVDGGNGANQELLQSILGTLDKMNSELQDMSLSNSAIQSNTTGSDSGGTAATTATQDVNITLQTNQQSSVRVSGIENLVTDLRTAVREAATEQADAQLEPLMVELESIFQVLRERGLLSSFGQPG